MSAGSNDELVTGLIEALKADSPAVRRAAVGNVAVLGRQAWPAATELAKLLKDRDPLLRLEVADALVRVGKGAVPALLESLKTDDEDLRRSVLITLGMIGPSAKAAIQPLLELRDKDQACAADANAALEKIIIGPGAIAAMKKLQRPLLTWVPLVTFAGLLLLLVLLWLAHSLTDAIREGHWLVVYIAVAWAIIGGGVGGIIGQNRWGRRGRFLAATLAILGGASAGALIGGILGPLVLALIRSLQGQV